VHAHQVKIAQEYARQELPEHRRLTQENGQVPHQFCGQQDDDEVQEQRDGRVLPRGERDGGKQEDSGEYRNPDGRFPSHDPHTLSQASLMSL